MRRVLVLLVTLSLGVPVLGAAASLAVAGRSLAAGSGQVKPCDTAFGHAFTTVSGTVTAVTVSGIADPACEGGVLTVRLTGPGVDVGSAPTTIPADPDTADDSVTVSFSPAPDADLVSGIVVSITGP